MYFKLKEENILNLMYVAVCAGVLALLYAFVLAGRVNKVGVGTDRMKEFWLYSQLFFLYLFSLLEALLQQLASCSVLFFPLSQVIAVCPLLQGLT